MNKKGVSAIIGYILLVSIVVVMGVLIFGWLSSYVPQESFDCPDGVSIALRDVSCISQPGSLNLGLTIKNTGRFNLDGYFIKASDDSDKLPTVDLNGDNLALFVPHSEGNNLGPNDEEVEFYGGITSLLDIKLIEIIPVRFQTENNRERVIICNNARVIEKISCGEVEIPLPIEDNCIINSVEWLNSEGDELNDEVMSIGTSVQISVTVEDPQDCLDSTFTYEISGREDTRDSLEGFDVDFFEDVSLNPPWTIILPEELNLENPLTQSLFYELTVEVKGGASKVSGGGPIEIDISGIGPIDPLDN